LLRAIGHWRSDRRFHRWRARNPGASHADFYAASVARRIAQGKSHCTLGSRGWLPGHGPAIQWDQDSFAERGLGLWQQIRDFGLTPDLRCVDYGCGSLRLGQHAIRFLEAGNYWGIDIVDTFIAQGLALIGPDLIEQKQPHLGVINDSTLADIASWKPDFIFSNAVLQHVPSDELDVYFERLAGMMTRGTRAYVLFITAERERRVKAMNWAYPADILLAPLARAGLAATVRDVAPGIRLVDGRERKVIEICLANAGRGGEAEALLERTEVLERTRQHDRSR
jgi:hypothetical protein